MAQNLVIWALMYLGELGEVSRRVPALLADARSRGNLYLAPELCTRSNYAWLAADDPDEGEREKIETIARWSHKGFHRQHYSAMLARAQTALYRGNPKRVANARRTGMRFRGSFRRPVIRLSRSTRARCAWRWPPGTRVPPIRPWLALEPGASPANTCRGLIRLACRFRPGLRTSRVVFLAPRSSTRPPTIRARRHNCTAVARRRSALQDDERGRALQRG
jgi:hypothetical protein